MILVSISHKSGQEDSYFRADSGKLTADILVAGIKCVVAAGLHRY